MRRREFIAFVCSTAAAWPLAARAEQPGKVFRIGFLGVSLEALGMAASYKNFSDELRENGFNEGQTLIIEYRRSDDPRGVIARADQGEAGI
jgi:putative ABC transport system substrate-binding protein